MNALNNLIDTAMKTCSPSNGEGLARRLGVTRSAVSKWRSGTPITDDHLIALGALAHASREDVLAVKIEIAGTSQARSFWRQFSAAASMAAVALCVMGLLGSGRPAVVSAHQFLSMHIMFFRRWFTAPAGAFQRWNNRKEILRLFRRISECRSGIHFPTSSVVESCGAGALAWKS